MVEDEAAEAAGGRDSFDVRSAQEPSPGADTDRETEVDDPGAGSPDMSSIVHVAEKAAKWRGVADLVRDLDGGKTDCVTALVDAGCDVCPPFRESARSKSTLAVNYRWLNQAHMTTPTVGLACVRLFAAW